MKSGTVCRVVLLMLAGFLFLGNSVRADNFPVISAKELKAKMGSGEKLVLINPLSDIEFNEGHIPGSINIPLNTFMTTDRLPSDKGTLIITYCLGPK